MQNRIKVLVASMVVVAALPATAQQKSHSSHVSLIARMPETLAFAVNSPGGSSDSLTGVGQTASPQIANSVSASWVLGRGRAGIVTQAYVNRPQSPVLIAFAAPDGAGFYGGTASDDFRAFHLPTQPKASSSRLDSFVITDSNRSATNTISLSDSVESGVKTLSPEDTYTGTMKIQIQTLP